MTKKSIVTLKNISKKFKETAAVSDASLEVREGEFLVILGPSGCGKTTLLRIMAGLEKQDAGNVYFEDQVVDDIPTQRRDIGVLFQNYTLFKHMTVAENIGFGLKIKKVSGEDRRRRITELLNLVGLSEMVDRMPNQLSGGQQQRIALARALASKPHLLLLDEPFGALDVKIRHRLRNDVKRIQKELGITTILVTHDQEEAFEMGDRVAVMNNGRIEHVGTPQEIYDHPKTEFVAGFVGTTNILAGNVEDGKAKLGYLRLDLGADSGKYKDNEKVKVFIRPEDVDFEKALVEMKDTDEITTGKIIDMMFLGPLVKIRISLGRGVSINAIKPKTDVTEKNFKEGDSVFVSIPHCKVFPEGVDVLISVPVARILKV